MSNEYPDKTLDELEEMDETEDGIPLEDDFEDVKLEIEELREGALLYLHAAQLAEMLRRSEITVATYVDMLDVIEDRVESDDIEMP